MFIQTIFQARGARMIAGSGCTVATDRISGALTTRFLWEDVALAMIWIALRTPHMASNAALCMLSRTEND